MFQVLYSIWYSLVECEVYSYHKFSGPVSGAIQEIQVPSPYGPKLDYVVCIEGLFDPRYIFLSALSSDFFKLIFTLQQAKPDYTYSYGIEDPYTGNRQERQEQRDGDTVHGQYSLLQADGTMRIVRYTADSKNGFQATVEYAPI